MSVNLVNSLGGQNTAQLVQQLASQIDANQDGQISTGELGSFLTTLLSAVSSSSENRRSDESTGRLTTEATSALAAETPPSSWTDNNAPYGVTLAGFSPQDHTNLTMADLGTPGKAEKYAVYEYLVTNKIQPTSSWAPAAADALNKKYPGNAVYRVIDGETLGFGSEYVHIAPNGYCMAPGTYNPNATGEFVWGVTDAAEVV